MEINFQDINQNFLKIYALNSPFLEQIDNNNLKMNEISLLAI